jgi:hypothetical protein
MATIPRLIGSSTAPLTADQAQLLIQLNNPGVTANQIYQDTLGCSTATCVNADAIRGVATATAGTTVVNTNGIAGYVMNLNPSGGVGQNSVGVFGDCIAAVNGSQCWGINTLITDNTSQNVGTGTGRTLNNEFDFNVMSPATTINGLLLQGNSLAQPANANGITVLPLHIGYYDKTWTTSFWSGNGASTSAMYVGTHGTPAAANVVSQPINFAYTDGSSALHTTQLYGSAYGINATANIAALGGTMAAYGTANDISMTGAASGNSVTLNAFGSDANINIALVPKGAGSIVVGTSIGVSCSGAPTGGYAVTSGLVTHC